MQAGKVKSDCLIIGAGLYGLYAALYCARKKGKRVIVLECDEAAFSRATYINQARVHMGYHYPRSISTAGKSAHYFRRFVQDYGFCINGSFQQIYAISSRFSWTGAAQFQKFCRDVGIPCEKIGHEKYFNEGCVEGAFLTEEYTYDAALLRDYFLKELSGLADVTICYRAGIEDISKNAGEFQVSCQDGRIYHAPFLLNATYASTNIISRMAGFELFKLKYELCEIILCNAGENLRDKGFTVMDGPFFSVMPFGKTGFHSLTSVTFTPHETSYAGIPEFSCQLGAGGDLQCGGGHSLGNCSQCRWKPESAWDYMAGLARKYIKPDYPFDYVKSLYSIKPILADAEIDDSRPTVIRVLSQNPTYITVLSGKINTVYDLDEVLEHEL